jgi:hypothetical protein
LDAIRCRRSRTRWMHASCWRSSPTRLGAAVPPICLDHARSGFRTVS